MNTPLRRVTTVVAALFAALLVSTTLIQVIYAPSINARPDNRRTLLDNYSRQRGAILVADQQIARSVATPNDEIAFLRTYPAAGLYSHVTGYFSYTYGAGGGLEGSADDLLSGSSDELFYTRVTDLLTGRTPVGASLQLTINAKAQQAATDALGNQRGAVVALDPKTGAVLALVMWVLASFVVRDTVGMSLDGPSIYGPLSAPIVVLIWLYALAIAVLVGAGLNAATRVIWPVESRTSSTTRLVEWAKSEVERRRTVADDVTGDPDDGDQVLDELMAHEQQFVDRSWDDGSTGRGRAERRGGWRDAS